MPFHWHEIEISEGRGFSFFVFGVEAQPRESRPIGNRVVTEQHRVPLVHCPTESLKCWSPEECDQLVINWAIILENEGYIIGLSIVLQPLPTPDVTVSTTQPMCVLCETECTTIPLFGVFQSHRGHTVQDGVLVGCVYVMHMHTPNRPQ
jgi:hypothetical protein